MATVSTRSSIRSTTRSTRLNSHKNVLRGNSSIINKPPPPSQRRKKKPQHSPPYPPTKRTKQIEEPNVGRRKRRRDDEEENLETVESPVRKKTRFVVEIEHRPQEVVAANPKVNNSKGKVNGGDLPAQPQEQQLRGEQTEAPPDVATQSREPKKSTIHHEKVANGIRHELGRLNPYGEDTKTTDEGRKLRSQEGTRFKSDLALYFPEYDEVIGNEPKEEHILNLETPIILIDIAKAPKQPTPKNATNTSVHPIKAFPDSLFDDLHDAQRVDFTFLEENCEDEAGEDPLSESYFVAIHRRPERSEKAIRNGDKGRAQHERDQVIRLLEGLQGSDWLKVMGVSGITESRKKEFEPARIHFIKGCQAIIEKFRTWREEEKRRKLEKDMAEAEAAEAEADEEKEDTGNGDLLSDVDASAARQLQEEATARSSQPSKTRTTQRMSKVAPPLPAPPVPEKEFKSFFEKPHEREAALRQHRRSGRKAAAWGRPMPDMPELDFDLPEMYRDEETLRAHARKKRRAKRDARS